MRQVVFTDVQITFRQSCNSPSARILVRAFPIGLHKIDAASDWLLIKWHYIGKKGLPEVQLQN